jgi:hypothetical protein
MEDTLMDCHERELLGQDPCDTYNSKSTKGLYERGLLATKLYVCADGRRKTVFYVTPLGKSVLKSLSEKKS